jgi:thioredoxin 1
MMAVNSKATNFFSLIQQEWVLVDFWAAWCTPCQKMTPILLACEKEIPAIHVVRVNVDEEPTIAEKCQVQGLPTLMIFHNGQPVRRVAGYQPKERVLAALADLNIV